MKTKVGEVYTLNTFQNVKCLKCISDTPISNPFGSQRIYNFGLVGCGSTI